MGFDTIEINLVFLKIVALKGAESFKTFTSQITLFLGRTGLPWRKKIVNPPKTFIYSNIFEFL